MNVLGCAFVAVMRTTEPRKRDDAASAQRATMISGSLLNSPEMGSALPIALIVLTKQVPRRRRESVVSTQQRREIPTSLGRFSN